VLLRPLPIADPARVVIVHDQLPKLNLMRTQVSSLQYLDYNQRTDIFEASAATTGSPVNLTGVDVPERGVMEHGWHGFDGLKRIRRSLILIRY
jgi:hypothetical protein